MYNNINKIGKIKSINNEFGVGEIVDTETIYLFTINDIKEDINVGDLVKFRAENINNENKAFFINKIDENYKLNDSYIKSKIYNKND